jgi:hypothetical protein
MGASFFAHPNADQCFYMFASCMHRYMFASCMHRSIILKPLPNTSLEIRIFIPKAI